MDKTIKRTKNPTKTGSERKAEAEPSEEEEDRDRLPHERDVIEHMPIQVAKEDVQELVSGTLLGSLHMSSRSARRRCPG